MIKANPYKGFETWFNSLRMSLKMYLYLFSIFFCVQILIILAGNYFLHGEVYAAFFGYFKGCLKGRHWPHTSVINEYLTYFLWHNVVMFAISSAIYIGYPFALRRFKERSQQQSQTKHLEGACLMDAQEFSRQIGKGDLPIGSIRLPRKEENKHCLAIGRTGCGKTVFLSQVVERLAERRAKAVIYDAKGDYTQRFFDPDRDILFNPLDARCTGWCLFDDIRTQLDINNVAASLIPPTYSGEAFWHDGARAVLSGILHYLWQQNMKSNDAIWAGVTAPAEMIHSWLKSIPQGQSGFRYIEDHGSKQALGVLSTMMQYTSVFEYMPDTGGFSITDWLMSDSGFIFVTNQADTQDTLRPVLSLLIDFLGKKLLSMPDDLQRRVFFLLDEFGSLQRLSSIKDLLIASRSKGGSCWIGIQDMGQLNKLYTRDLANTIINACGTSLVFGLSDPDTAAFLVKKIGDREILETEETTSMGVADNRDGVSITQRRKREPLLLNSQLLNLPDLTAYAKIPNHPAITLTRFEVKEYPARIAPFVIRDDLVLSDVVDRQEAGEGRAADI